MQCYVSRTMPAVTLLMLAASVAWTTSSYAGEPDLARVEKALGLIARFAESMCVTPTEKGSSFNAEVSVEAKAEVSKLVKKLAELKLEGASRLQSTEYQGLFQKDLIEALKNSATCKQNIYNDIKDRVLPPRFLPSASGAATSPRTSTSPLSISPGIIVGAWKEYILDPENNRWDYIGTYDVAQNKSGYIMSAREQREPPIVTPSIGLFDVQFDGKDWTFNSSWGKGHVGNFSLRKTSQTLFEGTVAMAGKDLAKTRWVKIQ